MQKPQKFFFVLAIYLLSGTIQSCNTNDTPSNSDSQTENPDSSSQTTIPQETLSEIAGSYSYSDYDIGSYSCSGSFCSKTNTFESASLIIDTQKNLIYCYQIKNSSTGSYYYGEGSSDSWANEDIASSTRCEVGTYDLISSSEDGFYNLKINFESTDFTENSTGEITSSEETYWTNQQITLDGFTLKKYSDTLIPYDYDNDFYYSELKAAVEDNTILRYYTLPVLKAVDVTGNYVIFPTYDENLAADADHSHIYDMLYDVDFETEYLFGYLQINNDQTYKSCTIIYDEVYAHSGSWEIDSSGDFLYTPNRYSYSEHGQENSEFSFIEYDGIKKMDVPGQDFYNEITEKVTGVEDLDNDTRREQIQSCLDYLESDSTEVLALTDNQYSQNQANNILSKVVGSFTANSDRMSSYHYDDNYDNDESMFTVIKIDSAANYEFCLYADGAYLYETGVLSLSYESYDDTEFHSDCALQDCNYELDSDNPLSQVQITARFEPNQTFSDVFAYIPDHNNMEYDIYFDMDLEAEELLAQCR